jgi:hypothetical protein
VPRTCAPHLDAGIVCPNGREEQMAVTTLTLSESLIALTAKRPKK